MIKLKPGIQKNVPNDDYHADRQYYSSSCLKVLNKSPELFYKNYILDSKEERADKAAFILGSYVHSLILEPHLIDKEYAVFDGASRRTNIYKQFRSENTDRTVILQKEVKWAHEMLVSFMKRPEAIGLIQDGEAELTLCLEMDGMPIKVRADYINHKEGYIVDVKTTGSDTDRASVINACNQWEYMLSAALYTKAFEQHYDKPFDFYWIFLGKYDGQCQVYKMSSETYIKAQIEIRKAITKFKEYSEKGNWMDYRIEEI